MLDLLKPIPAIKFPENKIPVGTPMNDSIIYLDNYFDCDSKYNRWVENDGKPLDGSSPSIAARKTVVQMLLDAEKLLPENYHFRIYDAYRTIAVQQALWDYFRKKKVLENPDKTNSEIDKLTSFFVSFPSYDILRPSLHNTGGAVDLTIIDSNNNELDMGCEFDDFTNKSWTNYYEQAPEISDKELEIRSNRRLLYNAMISVGFTNLPSEWWHFDFGDDKWAQLKNTTPLYAGILDAKIRNSTPYANMDEIRTYDNQQQKCLMQLIDIRAKCKDISAELTKIVASQI